MKKNFHTPDFNSEDINLKISPIYKKEDYQDRMEEGGNFMTCK
jgi:hypothetical protein